MSSLSDIKRRLASVKQTRQITGAMETVSVSKMRKTADLLEKSREYMNRLELVIRDLAKFDTSRESGAHNGADVVLVLSSDKGLCGSFDHDIFKFAAERIKDDDTVYPIGSVAAEHYKHRKNTDMRFSEDCKPDDATANVIAEYLLDIYAGGAKSVSIVFSKLIGSSPKPTFKTLLPIDAHSGAENEGERSENIIDCFEPSADEIKEVLVPLYMAGEIYGALINHSLCEHSARRAAMSAAVESADELIASLSAEYNRARQAAVTEQIVEIIGSTEALGNNEKRV